MLLNNLRIATRTSNLALYQANYVKDKLIKAYPNLSIQLIPIITRGDLILHTSLSKIGGKRLFIKELELALIQKKADIAVHSMKDVPINFPSNLGIVAICKRENPLDAFISNYYNSIENLPLGSIVGTCSMRRQCQIKNLRPDLIIKKLRGNIETRLNKLDYKQYHAIILAVAGLNRLGLHKRIKKIIPVEQMLPAVGQGAIGIECSLKNKNLINLLSILNDHDTFNLIKAERAMSIYLSANCEIPIGGYAILQKNYLFLRGLVGSIDGKKIIKAEKKGKKENAEYIGVSLAKKLLKLGAKSILSNFL